ncbi:MAG: hypothetical protein E7051_05990 [Lentisphaerae bacterium]|nr:hypothetical protein [Lentisphaerota bacterium]
MKISKVLTVIAAATAFSASADFHHTFERNTGGWVTYNYWGGKTTRSTEAARTGKGSMKMVATEKYKKVYALAICPLTAKNLSGTKVRLSFYAKGTGNIKAGVLNYTRNGKGGEKMDWVYCQPVTLNDQWQKVEYIADYTTSFVERCSPAIRIEGEGTAYIDDLDIIFEKPKAVVMKSLDGHQIIREGAALPKVKFNFTTPDETITFFAISGNTKNMPVITSAINDEKGNVTYEGAATFPAGEVTLIAAAGGRNAVTYGYVMPAAEYDELDKVAASIKLAKPLHILYIGDSVTDFERDNNHADKLSFWLNKHNPGKASFQNLAVGGDFITRVEGRMDKKANLPGSQNQWRQYMYDPIFNRPYDLILIFLGHNDCASFYKAQYKVPQVALKDAEASYKRVIEKLRAKSKAPIVLITPVANNVEVSKKQGALSAKYGGPGAIFGLPEFVLPFNAMLKKVAAETNCYFIDLYSAMKGNADIPKWFVRDGIHFTPAGNQQVAGLILKALAEKGSPLK